MASDALTIAKEITIALVSRLNIPNVEPEATGEMVGKIFKVVLKQVVEGINEANK